MRTICLALLFVTLWNVSFLSGSQRPGATAAARFRAVHEAGRVAFQAHTAGDVVAPLASPETSDDVTKLKKRLRDDIKVVTKASLKSAGDLSVKVTQSLTRDDYRLDRLIFQTRNGTELVGAMAVPTRAMNADLRRLYRGDRPAVLLLDARPLNVTTAVRSDVDLLAKDGSIVLVFQHRRAEPDVSDVRQSRSLLTTASLADHTTIGQRIDDAFAALGWLRRQKSVGRDLTVHGIGSDSVVALHMAALEDYDRIPKVILENLVMSYRLFDDNSPRGDLKEYLIPGVLRYYDIPDLLLATFAKKLAIVTPIDANGSRLTPDAYAEAFAALNRSELNLVKSSAASRSARPLLRLTVLFGPR